MPEALIEILGITIRIMHSGVDKSVTDLTDIPSDGLLPAVQ